MDPNKKRLRPLGINVMETSTSISQSRITRTRDRQDKKVRDERQDRQIWHLNLTFQVTCAGQLRNSCDVFYLTLWPSSFSMRIWVLREIGQLSDILHFSLEMTNHPISFQRGAILPNLDPQNNFPISKCYLYIGFQYVKIETFPKCWRKLKK